MNDVKCQICQDHGILQIPPERAGYRLTGQRVSGCPEWIKPDGGVIVFPPGMAYVEIPCVAYGTLRPFTGSAGNA